MRLSSEMFPFASHAKYGYSLDYAAAELKVSMSSPGMYRILTPLWRRPGISQMDMVTELRFIRGSSLRLGAPSQMLSTRPSGNYSVCYPAKCLPTIRSYQTRIDHCSILQYMGMGKDSVMIIHMGVRT